MKIYSVYDEEFANYGRIIDGYDTKDLAAEMNKIALPESGTSYRAGIDAFEKLPIYNELLQRAFGGLPIEMGMCWGNNTKLNCLEYHRSSEINFGPKDFILLLAKREEMKDGMLDTGCVKAFRVPAGVMIEVFATTLHFAPCNANKDEGFRTLVVLPKGTNLEKPKIEPKNFEDELLWANNKWLIAHRDSKQAGMGAYIGLAGENIDIIDLI